MCTVRDRGTSRQWLAYLAGVAEANAYNMECISLKETLNMNNK